jgi:D-alanyl-D-alanine carboxypeptidase/D-alanyl-D-alanine-endopeptidase (penicillin-binding protein 4)
MDLIRWKNLFGGLGLLFILVLADSCTLTKNRVQSTQSLTQKFEKSPVFNEAFSAMVLYDPMTDEVLFERNGDKCFIPASNTKIATLLATIELLGDSLPLLAYTVVNDTLYVKGTGNPLHLNPYFRDNQQLNKWIRSFEDFPVAYVPADPAPAKYGSGWAWDDYMYAYQLENAAFPIYGNQLTLTSDGKILKVVPGLLNEDLRLEKDDLIRFQRSFDKNDFQITTNNVPFNRALPFHWTDSLAMALWQDEVDREIHVMDRSFGETIRSWEKLYMPFSDSLFVQLMQESDNFIAEQLLLSISGVLADTLDQGIAIREAKTLWEPFLRDSMRWVDGSGLSRYNLFTPFTFVQLLDRLYTIKSWEWIASVFPTGGASGTIESWYDAKIHAKTGTLSNNHNLSGYIEVKSGRVLIFSFMHNHFLGTNKDFKEEMQRFLDWVEDNF